MSKLRVTLVIYTQIISAADVTYILGCQPDHVTIKGSERMPPRVRPPMHAWSIEAEEEDSYDVLGLLSKLLERVRLIAPGVAKIRAVDPATEIVLFVTARPFSVRLSYHFDNEVIALLAAIGSKLDLDFPDSNFGETFEYIVTSPD